MIKDSRKPSYNINSLLGILGDQWCIVLFFLDQFFQFWQAFLKLFLSWWIFSDVADKLNGVDSGLFTLVIKQLDDLVQFVKIVDLNFALLVLGQGGEGSGGGCSDVCHAVGEHLAEWGD